MTVQTVVVWGPELRRATVALAFAQRKLPRDVNASLRAATLRGVGKAKAKALTIPVHGKKHKGTRRLLSRGVGYRKTPLGYRATTSMPAGMEALPRGFETSFRHPVFGDKSNWVTQHTHYPWFTEPFSEEYGMLTYSLINDLHDTAKTIDKMTGG